MKTKIFSLGLTAHLLILSSELEAYEIAKARCSSFHHKTKIGSIGRASPSSNWLLVHPNSSLLFKRVQLDDTFKSSRNGDIAVSDNLIKETSLALSRTSWFSWWSQVILTVVSSVTLIFSRSVLSSIEGPRNRSAGFFLASTGIGLSALSIFWTWGAARLARRLITKETTRIKASNMLRRTIQIGTTLNLLGMLVTIIGAEEIVGKLCAKVLTTQGVSPLVAGGALVAAGATQVVQPLDILIVQANVNILLSHFMSLASTYFLNSWVDRLDPPSVED